MKITLSTLFLMLAFNSSAQTEATTSEGKKVLLYNNGTWKYAKSSTTSKTIKSELKKEAMEFTRQLVESYFEGNCSLLQQSLANEIFTFEKVITVTNEINQKICQSVKTSVIDSTKTFKDYELIYKIELFSKTEVEAKAKSKLPVHFNTTQDEFYFLGFEQKALTTTTNFISNRLFALLIRKVDGKWLVKGFLND